MLWKPLAMIGSFFFLQISKNKSLFCFVISTGVLQIHTFTVSPSHSDISLITGQPEHTNKNSKWYCM